MTDPDLFTFIRNYDIIFFIETMKGNDFTLAIPGYKFHRVSRKLNHKNACRASGGIGILIKQPSPTAKAGCLLYSTRSAATVICFQDSY